MQVLARFRSEFSSHEFSATVYTKGRLSAKQGLIINITSPNDHLGGLGIGVPYIRSNGKKSANYSSFSFPSHRDGELAGRIAQIVAKYTRRHTLVILGMTLPQLTPSRLHDLTRFFEDWFRDICQKLVNEAFLHSNTGE
ncbi:MAG: hypothetical protein ACFFE8_00795 [Candidatus Heimdallarchaeota archaeon]